MYYIILGILWYEKVCVDGNMIVASTFSYVGKKELYLICYNSSLSECFFITSYWWPLISTTQYQQQSVSDFGPQRSLSSLDRSPFLWPSVLTSLLQNSTRYTETLSSHYIFCCSSSKTKFMIFQCLKPNGEDRYCTPSPKE